MSSELPGPGGRTQRHPRALATAEAELLGSKPGRGGAAGLAEQPPLQERLSLRPHQLHQLREGEGALSNSPTD